MIIKMKKRTNNPTSTNWLCLFVFLTLSITQRAEGQTTGNTTQKIGDYIIPEDTLKDNFCTAIEKTKFQDLDKVDGIYSGFVEG